VQRKRRKLLMIVLGALFIYFLFSALVPEIMITSIHTGKRTYHPNWRLF
jgi:hypothetical protein